MNWYDDYCELNDITIPPVKQTTEYIKKSRIQISIIWNIDDILGRAEYLNINLTDDQAINILKNI